MIPINLITQHYEYLLHNSRRYLSCIDDRKDLVQDTMLKALMYAERSSPKNIKAWLSFIMYSLFIDRLRRKQSMIRDVDFPYNANFDSHIDYHYISKHITNRPRLLVYMYAQGYSYQELADHFKCPLGTIQTQIHRGRKQLCQLMK